MKRVHSEDKAEAKRLLREGYPGDKKPNGQAWRKEAPVKICFNCSLIVYTGTRICPECGYVFYVRKVVSDANKKALAE